METGDASNNAPAVSITMRKKSDPSNLLVPARLENVEEHTPAAIHQGADRSRRMTSEPLAIYPVGFNEFNKQECCHQSRRQGVQLGPIGEKVYVRNRRRPAVQDLYEYEYLLGVSDSLMMRAWLLYSYGTEGTVRYALLLRASLRLPRLPESSPTYTYRICSCSARVLTPTWAVEI